MSLRTPTRRPTAAARPAGASVAVVLEALPASYGDCLLLTCAAPGRPGGAWRMLVDTGPDETYPALRARLARLPVGDDGDRHVDLLVVTHIDHDHIGGVAQLLDDGDLRLRFGDIWFNAPTRPPVHRGVAEGETLARLLGARDRRLPWNAAFGGRPAATPAAGGVLPVAMPADAPRITLLSPTPRRLEALFKVWDRELAKLQRGEPSEPREPSHAVGREAWRPDLEALAARTTATDRAAANGSSIAFLLEHGGRSLLFAADAFSTVLVPALAALARERGAPGPLALDLVKLSHHGSRANVTDALFRVVQAREFVVSTNGSIFDHPDDEALARTVLHGAPPGVQPVLRFNYATARTLRWAAVGEQHGFGTAYPAAGEQGIVVELGAPAALVRHGP